jgi:hypothetical protein
MVWYWKTVVESRRPAKVKPSLFRLFVQESAHFSRLLFDALK